MKKGKRKQKKEAKEEVRRGSEGLLWIARQNYRHRQRYCRQLCFHELQESKTEQEQKDKKREEGKANRDDLPCSDRHSTARYRLQSHPQIIDKSPQNRLSRYTLRTLFQHALKTTQALKKIISSALSTHKTRVYLLK